MQNLSGESDPVEVQKYQLDGVKGAVHTTQKVTNSPFPNYDHKRKCWCQGALHESGCPHGTSAQSPVASSSGAHSHLLRATPWLFEGTNLLMQYEHSCHGNTS